MPRLVLTVAAALLVQNIFGKRVHHADRMKMKATQKGACERSTKWCRNGNYSIDRDCDGDGIADPYCESPRGTGFLSSGTQCTDTWPNGICQKQFEKAEAGCPRPSGWCARRGGSGYSKERDCDGDGMDDHYCESPEGRTGFISTKDGCTDTWPDGVCGGSRAGGGFGIASGSGDEGFDDEGFDHPDVIGDEYHAATCGGTGGGEPCHFPLTYSGRSMISCTSEDHDEPWCYTDAEKHWGNCNCGPDQARPRQQGTSRSRHTARKSDDEETGDTSEEEDIDATTDEDQAAS